MFEMRPKKQRTRHTASSKSANLAVLRRFFQFMQCLTAQNRAKWLAFKPNVWIDIFWLDMLTSTNTQKSTARHTNNTIRFNVSNILAYRFCSRKSLAQFCSSARVKKNLHMQNCHTKIARVERSFRGTEIVYFLLILYRTLLSLFEKQWVRCHL